MIIYPKISEKFDGLEIVKPYVIKYKGIEIQMLSWNEIEKVEGIIKDLKSKIPEIEEVTIHPPLTEEYNFEVLSYCNFQNEIERIKCFIEITKKLNIQLNLLYHTRWIYKCWKSSGSTERLKELVKLIQNTNVNILIENIYSLEEKNSCTVLQIAREINNSHLGVCLDICHLHVEANIYGMNFDEFLDNYLSKEDCKKYIYQIHFAGTLNNDGFREKKTHGRKHPTLESFEMDYNILKKYEIEDKIIVAEISEDDYTTRVEQLEEIKMLENAI